MKPNARTNARIGERLSTALAPAAAGRRRRQRPREGKNDVDLDLRKNHSGTRIETRSSHAAAHRHRRGRCIGLILLCVVFSVTSDVFLSPRNFLNIIDQVTVLGILALGMTGVIIIGGIDLSVGSILAVSCMVFGWLPQDYGIPYFPQPSWPSLPAALADWSMACSSRGPSCRPSSRR